MLWPGCVVPGRDATTQPGFAGRVFVMCRIVRCLLLLGALLTGLVAGSAPRRAMATPAAGQDGPYHAALVVQFADKTVETRCVAFSEPTITGADLLARSGLRTVLDYNAGLGGAVCSINNQGCAFPRESCFCRCQGAECEYWAYYAWENDAWRYSSVGASNRQVADGALEAWSWGPGNWTGGTEPPPVTFAEVCGPFAAGAVAPAQPSAMDGAVGIAAVSEQLFPRELLPGYAAYLFTAAVLVFIGIVVLRRGKGRALDPDRTAA